MITRSRDLEFETAVSLTTSRCRDSDGFGLGRPEMSFHDSAFAVRLIRLKPRRCSRNTLARDPSRAGSEVDLSPPASNLQLSLRYAPNGLRIGLGEVREQTR